MNEFEIKAKLKDINKLYIIVQATTPKTLPYVIENTNCVLLYTNIEIAEIATRKLSAKGSFREFHAVELYDLQADCMALMKEGYGEFLLNGDGEIMNMALLLEAVAESEKVALSAFDEEQTKAVSKKESSLNFGDGISYDSKTAVSGKIFKDTLTDYEQETLKENAAKENSKRKHGRKSASNGTFWVIAFFIVLILIDSCDGDKRNNSSKSYDSYNNYDNNYDYETHNQALFNKSNEDFVEEILTEENESSAYTEAVSGIDKLPDFDSVTAEKYRYEANSKWLVGEIQSGTYRSDYLNMEGYLPDGYEWMPDNSSERVFEKPSVEMYRDFYTSELVLAGRDNNTKIIPGNEKKIYWVVWEAGACKKADVNCMECLFTIAAYGDETVEDWVTIISEINGEKYTLFEKKESVGEIRKQLELRFINKKGTVRTFSINNVGGRIVCEMKQNISNDENVNVFRVVS